MSSRSGQMFGFIVILACVVGVYFLIREPEPKREVYVGELVQIWTVVTDELYMPGPQKLKQEEGYRFRSKGEDGKSYSLRLDVPDSFKEKSILTPEGTEIRQTLQSFALHLFDHPDKRLLVEGVRNPDHSLKVTSFKLVSSDYQIEKK